MKCIRYQSRLLLFCSFVLLTVPLLVTPVHADRSQPLLIPAEPADPPPHMDFQPPPDADEIADFVPPGIELVHSNPGPDQEVVDDLKAGEGQVFAFNDDKIVVVIEDDTFPEHSQILFQEIPVPDQLDNKDALENGRSPVITATHTISTPFETEILSRFQIEVQEADSARAYDELPKPVRLVVDLRQHGFDLEQTGGTYFLAYEDEKQPGQWHEVPVEPHGQTGLISAEVQHFSTWEAGWRPDMWTLQWAPPTNDEFTGSAIYNYPLQLPPGRHNLAPSLALFYSSSALRGLGNRGANSGSVATGWQISDINITRTGVQLKPTGSGYNYPASFRLTLNGKGGRLVAGATSGNSTLYYVEDMPQLRVYNYNGTNYNGSVNSYWVVQTGDGTNYRLGYTADAVTLHSIKGPASNDTTYSDPEIIIWHIDTITDAFGNQINYTYVNHERTTETNPLYLYVKTQNKDLAEISYNFPGRITTLPPAATVTRLRDTSIPASKVIFAYDAQKYLQSVKIYHGGQEIRRYIIQAVTNRIDNNAVGGPKCAMLDSDGSWGGSTYTRVISSITEQGFDNNGNPVSCQPPPLSIKSIGISCGKTPPVCCMNICRP